MSNYFGPSQQPDSTPPTSSTTSTSHSDKSKKDDDEEKMPFASHKWRLFRKYEHREQQNPYEAASRLGVDFREQ